MVVVWDILPTHFTPPCENSVQQNISTRDECFHPPENHSHQLGLQNKSYCLLSGLFKDLVSIVNLPFFAAHIHDIIVRVYHSKCERKAGNVSIEF